MVFSSLSFLFIFMPLVFCGYMFFDRKYSNTWLVISSLVFYYIGDKQHILLLCIVIGISYIAGVLLDSCFSRKKKIITSISSIIIILAVMSYFKYWDFMIMNVNNLFNKNISIKGVVFPVGISFFSFQAISYIVDIYKGGKALKNPIDLILYISFFPQLIAGPIVRYKDVKEYIFVKNRPFSFDDVGDGVWRFCIGLSKKVIIANNLGLLADMVFDSKNITNISILLTWLGVIAYTLQIYYDFSGYSDMAIGLGRMFGFKFQENFNYPYIANSVKDFWRRWHISLSQFFRDYVYIPLGGNRAGACRWVINIIIVWFLTGLWHGASWNYILWGLSYGIFLLLEKLISLCINLKNNIFIRIIRHVYVFLVVELLWALFRANDIGSAVAIYKNMFGCTSSRFVDNGFVFHLNNYVLLLIIAGIGSTPLVKNVANKMDAVILLKYLKTIMLLGVTIISFSYIYMGNYNPFLYFMF